MKPIITKTVLVLSLVSLLTDISSELLYPIMPIYLKAIGFSVLLIGILEGIAEAVAGLSKGYFGYWSDSIGKRVPFIQIGYLFSAISKPMFAVFTYPLWIFGARFIDRLGKGIRTSARDSLLSAESSIENKGKVFGFHRAMDTLGAAIGPILALIYLYFNPNNYTNLFIIAFFPALIGVLLTFFIKERPFTPKVKNNYYNPFSYFKYWKTSSKKYKKILIGILLFTLFNSSDAFLLLMGKHKGLSDYSVILAYIFYNLTYALFSYPGGKLADKIGMKNTFIIGLLFFAITYLGMVYVNNLYTYLFLLFIYGIYGALNEGIIKAWISKITPMEQTGTAIGLYTSLASIVTLIASSGAGVIWFIYGPNLTFILSGLGALIVVVYFLVNSSIK